LHTVSAVYPTRLHVPAFVDWLLGLYDRRRLRLFNRNHSTISIKESVSIKESTTVKAMQLRSLSRTRNTEMGLLPDRTRNNEAPRIGMEASGTNMEASRTTAAAAST
jgi:hypothetical protein